MSLNKREYPEQTDWPFLYTPSGVQSTFLPAKYESTS